VAASGWFSTNGAGGTVSYAWIRTDTQGNRWVIPEPSLTIARGDTSVHTVQADNWTPQSPGSEQLVFYSPAAPVLAPKSFSCVASNQVNG
jgi:hypothetical protein